MSAPPQELPVPARVRARTLHLLHRPIGAQAEDYEGIAVTLQELGLEPVLSRDRDRFAADEIVLVFGNPGWYPQAMAALAAAPAEARPSVAFWVSEPLPPPRGSGLPAPRLGLRELELVARGDPGATDVWTNARRLRRLSRLGLPHVLAVTSTGKQEYLAQRGIASEVVPLGSWWGLGRDLAIERDIDVLFLGALGVPRRRKALRRLRHAGLDVQAAGDWQAPELWGERRTELLNRVRVLLNVSRHHGQYAGQRLLLGAANGAAFVSEPIYRPEPWRPGEHYLEAQLDEMPAVVERLLGDEPARAALAERARAFAADELTLRRSLIRILELVHRRLELDDA